MTQYSRPYSDISTGGWTSPSWSNIDEGCASYDGVFTTSPNKASATLQCSLSSVNDPLVSSGYLLRVRGYVVATGVYSLTLHLYSGTTLIKSWSPSWTGSSAEYSVSLTTSEADAITNHNDLRIWFQFTYTSGSQGRAYIDAFDFEVPDAALSPIYGDANLNLESAALSGNGFVLINAILTKSLEDITFVSDGDTVIVGNFDKLLDSTLLNSTGISKISGSVDSTLENLVLSSSGTVPLADYYELQRHSGDNNWVTISTPISSPYDDNDGLINGTTYTYRIRHVVNGTPGAWSNEAVLTFSVVSLGSLSVTLEDANISSSSSVKIEGESFINLSDLTSDSVAKVKVEGNLDSELESAAVASSSKAIVDGDLNKVLDNLTVTSSGVILSHGELSKTLDDASLLSNGTVALEGGVSIFLDSVTILANGVVGNPPITADANITLNDVTIASVSKVLVAGSLATTLDSTTIISDGKVLVSGSGNITLDSINLTSSGIVGYPAISAIADITLENATVVSSVNVEVHASSNVLLGDDILNSNGEAKITSNSNIYLENAESSSEVCVIIRGGSSVYLEDVILAASATVFTPPEYGLLSIGHFALYNVTLSSDLVIGLEMWPDLVTESLSENSVSPNLTAKLTITSELLYEVKMEV